MNEWYESLESPALAPPNWVFGPVWTILYVMIAVSLYLFVMKRTEEKGYAIYVLIVLHLISNFSWTSLFFGLQSPGLALIDIVVLDVSLMVLIYYFWQSCRAASVLLWPYMLWVLFATYLNAAFYSLN